MIHSEILTSSNDPGRDGAAGHVHATAEKVSSGKYSITVDPQTAFVRITLDGFFALGDVQEFAIALARAYAGLASGRGHHLTLCDVSECKIQPQEVVEGFRRLLTDRSLMSERLAFVTGASPAKMQIRRLIARDTCRFFEQADAAERWLLDLGRSGGRADAAHWAGL